ncbi:hypothetical protein BC829DRAFT_216503 [Chytridium lagenaria]|nr:hypothetical protein BC829DRAFT_216503 [Chytridium lagenaria]
MLDTPTFEVAETPQQQRVAPTSRNLVPPPRTSIRPQNNTVTETPRFDISETPYSPKTNLNALNNPSRPTIVAAHGSTVPQYLTTTPSFNVEETPQQVRLSETVPKPSNLQTTTTTKQIDPVWQYKQQPATPPPPPPKFEPRIPASPEPHSTYTKKNRSRFRYAWLLCIPVIAIIIFLSVFFSRRPSTSSPKPSPTTSPRPFFNSSAPNGDYAVDGIFQIVSPDGYCLQKNGSRVVLMDCEACGQMFRHTLLTSSAPDL